MQLQQLSETELQVVEGGMINLDRPVVPKGDQTGTLLGASSVWVNWFIILDKNYRA
jgi:hypothetical protein